MKKVRLIASVMALALTVTSVCVCSGEADAAKSKKVSLKKRASVTVGKTVKLKVKNGKKKAKVTWKSSKSKVAKITKKTTKGNKATATVKGIKKGTSTITATYKLGKKKTKLKCKVTVNPKKVDPIVSTGPVQPTQTPTVSDTPAPTSNVTDAPNTPTNTPNVTKAPTSAPTPKATPVADRAIWMSYKDINIDGEIDVAWDFATAEPISHWKADDENKTAQTSDAYAKILWTEKYLYVMVEAKDPEIDCGNDADYLQDSVELFVDEYDNKEDWGSSNEFQYRTVIKRKPSNDPAVTPKPLGSLTDKKFWDGGDIKTAVKTSDEGYVVEFAVPLNKVPVEKDFIGIEVQINDAQDGARNGTWNLFADPANGDPIPYDSTLVFGDCQYEIKREPKEIELDLKDSGSTNMELPDQFSEKDENGNILYYNESGTAVCTKSYDPETRLPIYKDMQGNDIPEPLGSKKPTEKYSTMNTKSGYDSEKGLVYCQSANNIVIYFPEGRKIYKGEKAKIEIHGTYTVAEGAEIGDSDNIFRTWLVDTYNRTRIGDSPITVSNQDTVIPFSMIRSDDGKFTVTGDFFADGPDKAGDDGYVSDGTADGIMIKAMGYDGQIGYDSSKEVLDSFVLNKVVLTVWDPVEYVEPPTPTEPGEDDESVKKLDLSQVHFADEGIGSYDADTGLTINDTRTEGTTEMYIPLPITVSPGQKLRVTISGPKWGTGDFRIWTTPVGGETSGNYVDNNQLFLNPTVADDKSFTGTVELTAKGEDCTRITLKPGMNTRIQNLIISDIKVSIVEPEPEPAPNLINPYHVDLRTVEAVGEAGEAPNYKTDTKTLESDMGWGGFIIYNPATERKDEYKYVEITYQLEGGDVNLYLGKEGFTTGQNAVGWSGEIKLNKYDMGKEVKLLFGADEYLGENEYIDGLKFFNYKDDVGKMSIKAITFYMDGDKSAPTE